jgi:Zn-dependent M28 family amino/carboxypeptidase
MVAHINLDMVGRNGSDSLFVIGSRRLSTEFGDWLEQANARLSPPFELDYTFDAPDHPEMLYCRSDHWNFARFGIPSVMIGSGLHDDYHKPSDHADKVNYEKIQRLVELTAALTERVANSPTPPAVDKPVPPIGTPCAG